MGGFLKNVQIGTVENFQGQEKKVIVLSLVRSRKQEAISDDKRCNLGFLAAPQRTTVAISRCKALLVVIGNLQLLSKDESWHKVIDMGMNLNCVENLSLADIQNVSAELSRPLPSQARWEQDPRLQYNDQPFQTNESGYADMQ